MILLDKAAINDPKNLREFEWLETNGIGGFALSTVSGIHSRRYHGLLTAAINPPLGRVTALSKYLETVKIGELTFELSATRFAGAQIDGGLQYFESFRADPFPTWKFEIDGIEIEKRVFMVYGRNAVITQWRLNSPVDENVTLCLKPLISYCDYHHLQLENPEFRKNTEISEGLVAMKPYEHLPGIFFTHNAVNAIETGFWYKNFEYITENERGFDFHEDLFQPLKLDFDLKNTAIIVAEVESPDFPVLIAPEEVFSLETAAIAGKSALLEPCADAKPLESALIQAADQFIVKRGDGKTVIAGYPWFSDWGRDTMIALPGLTLTTGRFEIARDILAEFAKHFSEGMLPNRFPDEGKTPEYNTVDATLWYFQALQKYVEATQDYLFVESELFDRLANVIEWHVSGTRYGIKMDDDGLIAAGTPDVQLTWMDAKIGSLVVTPRNGKAVEIQALWFNALRIMADFAECFCDNRRARIWNDMARTARKSFNETFWNDQKQCLYDFIGSDGANGQIRPNQIIAASLTHKIIDKVTARKVVDVVEEHLLTPYGLRSLSPRDPQYCPRYEGSPFDRDTAYHQGTVWAWLIGPFIDAYRFVNPATKKTQTKIDAILAPFAEHVMNAGLGQISEIFDAEVPHTPRGCPAQAWSVAEVLRSISKK